MAFTIVEKVEAHETNSAAGLTTPSFSWDADRYLVCFYGGAQGSGGDFTISFSSTTGLTWQEVPPSPEHVDYSIGDGNLYVRVAKTSSGGSGTITMTASEAIDQRSVHVFQVDGVDLSGSDALAAIVQAAENDTAGSTTTEELIVTYGSTTDVDNLLFVGMETVITDSEPIAPFVVLTNDYTGAQGSMTCAYAVDEALTTISIKTTPVDNPLGGVAAIALEILGIAPVEEDDMGWGILVNP